MTGEHAAQGPAGSVDLLIFDFDGVLTDNRVWVFEDGREAVACNRADGLGFSALRKAGLPAMIMSTETNPVVSARGRKLQVPVLQSIEDKGETVRAYCRQAGIAPERVMFVGNDLNDLPAMAVVGWPVAVADAHPAVIRAARVVLATPGGAGVVREIVESLLALGSWMGLDDGPDVTGRQKAKTRQEM